MRWPSLVVCVLALSVPSLIHGQSPPGCQLSLDARQDWQQRLGAVLSDESARIEGAELNRLLDCFDHPDPAIRDQWVFESLSQLLRGGKVDADGIAAAIDRLQPALNESEASSPAAKSALVATGGFRQPFAALLLSELVRADRVTPALPAERVDRLAQSASEYLSSISDYRAFDQTQGWRHGVAHGADLLLQLAVHPALGKQRQSDFLPALKLQIRTDTLAYTHAEPERLARAAYYLHQRGDVGAESWTQWLTELAAPAPLDNWGQAYQREQDLRRRHNVLAFLQALGFAARQGGGAQALAEQCDQQIVRVLSGAE